MGSRRHGAQHAHPAVKKMLEFLEHAEAQLINGKRSPDLHKPSSALFDIPWARHIDHGRWIGDGTTKKKEKAAYRDKVQHPMDFGTVIRELRGGRYCQKLKRGDLARLDHRSVNVDVQLTFTNFFTANVDGDGGLEDYADYVSELKDQWEKACPFGEEDEEEEETEEDDEDENEDDEEEDEEGDEDEEDEDEDEDEEDGNYMEDDIHRKRVTIVERLLSQGGSSQAFRGILDENTADGKEEGDRGE